MKFKKSTESEAGQFDSAKTIDREFQHNMPELSKGFVKWNIAGERLNGTYTGVKPVKLANGDSAVIVYMTDEKDNPVMLWGNKLLLNQMSELGLKIGNQMTVIFNEEVKGKSYSGDDDGKSRKYYSVTVTSKDCQSPLKELSDLSSDDLPF